MTLLGRWLALPVLTLTLSATLAGCATGSSDTKPQVLSSPAPVATSASPNPAPPTPQAEIEAAIRHYYDTVNAAVSTGDTEQLKALSDAGCGCRRLITDIDRVYTNGHSEGAKFEVDAVQPQDIHGVTATADVSYRVTPYRVLDRADKLLQQVPEYRGHDLLSLQLVGGRWLLVNAHHLGEQ